MRGYFTLLECNELCVLITSRVCHSASLSLSMSCLSHQAPRGSRSFSFPWCPLCLALSLHSPLTPIHCQTSFLLSFPGTVRAPACQCCTIFTISTGNTLEWDREWKSVTIALPSWHVWTSSCQVSNLSASVPFQIGNCSICYKSGFRWRATAGPGHQSWNWLA